MLREALKEPRNQRFLLLSDSGVPLYPPTAMWQHLMGISKSRINACTPVGASCLLPAFWNTGRCACLTSNCGSYALYHGRLVKAFHEDHTNHDSETASTLLRISSSKRSMDYLLSTALPNSSYQRVQPGARM
jgi:hypothetical protein